MSEESLKFFDDKSPEEIINWMLDKLTEDQIKLCLESSGIPPPIPEPSASTPIPEPSSSTTPDAGEGVPLGTPTDTPGDTQALLDDPFDLGLDAGGSSETPAAQLQAAVVTVDPGPPVPISPSASELLRGLMERCVGSPVIVGKIEGENIVFWEFKYSARKWEKNTMTIAQFEEFKCLPQDVRRYASKKGKLPRAALETMDTETKEALRVYVSLGIEGPIDLEAPKITQEAQNLATALQIQMNMAGVLQETAEELVEFGITIPPLFLASASSNGVEYYAIIIEDGNLKLEKQISSMSDIQSKFLEVIEDLKENIDDGEYTLDPYTIPNIQTLLNSLPSKEKDKIRAIYTAGSLPGITLFGSSRVQTPSKPKFGKKGVASLSIKEIEAAARNKFGDAYVNNLKPKITIRKNDGAQTVQWVKRN